MTVPEFDQALLDKLFPAPSFASAFTSPYAPTPNAGITPDSTATLQRLLKENHQRHHLFFNERGFHNHLTHHLFAAYGIGAPPRVLQEAYDEHASYQRPAYKSPEKVTRDNWKKFLGDEDYYNAYMGFFNEEIEQHGLPSTLERYVFSHEANWSDNEPRMLDRFLAGLLHPMIHFGHAAEFGVPGMAVEGLAQTAVHKVAYQKLFDANFFGSSSTGSYLSTLTSALTLGATSTKTKAHTHAFNILARVLADSRLEAGNPCRFESTQKFTDTLDSVGDIIREYADLWTVDEDKKVIQDRVEELQWFVTTVFGLGGWKKDKPFKADFFLAHLVTSDLFLPSILSLLKPSDQVALMRAYFAACLGYFVSRGRPALDIEGFFKYTSLDPKPPADKTEATEAKTNPWYAVLAHTVPHKDEHHVKAERAMAHGAALYGARPKGWFKDTELKGAEHMDGTLFIRVGGLLMGAMNWQFILGNGGKRVARDETSDVEAGWDRAGLGWAEAWD